MSDQPESKPQPECPGPILCSAFGTEHVHAWRDTPETAAELERLRQERAQMGLRIFVAEKELNEIALNHAEPARSGVVAAIGALNGDFPNGAKGTELEMDRLRETNRELVELLKLLDRLGGLGHDKHEWIRKAVARAKATE